MGVSLIFLTTSTHLWWRIYEKNLYIQVHKLQQTTAIDKSEQDHLHEMRILEKAGQISIKTNMKKELARARYLKRKSNN